LEREKIKKRAKEMLGQDTAEKLLNIGTKNEENDT
jgi:hypothetical protein